MRRWKRRLRRKQWLRIKKKDFSDSLNGLFTSLKFMGMDEMSDRFLYQLNEIDDGDGDDDDVDADDNNDYYDDGNDDDDVDGDDDDNDDDDDDDDNGDADDF